MAHWLFNSAAESWTGFSIVWISDEGSPGLGCIGREGASAAATAASIIGQSISVVVGDRIYFRFRLTGFNPSCSGLADGSMQCYNSVGTLLGQCSINGQPMPGDDSGWIAVAGAISTTGTVATVTVAAGCGFGSWDNVYYDTIYVAETPPSIFDLVQSAGGGPGSVMVTT